MTDERGGRYFREARFFLAGDKVAAQSHILEARSLMGYMRDMHALGGPPIQVQYATLQDGTRIKAVMMNGQYQAEIVSPVLGDSKKCKRPRVPTIFGYRTHNDGLPTQYREAFKWQEGTGIVYLSTPDGYTIGAGVDCIPSISLDGETVSSDVVIVGGGSYARHAIWRQGVVEVVPGVDAITHLMDVTYGDTTPIPSPVAWDGAGDQLDSHRYIRVPEDDCTATGDHLIYGWVFLPGDATAATVERSGSVVADDVLTLVEPFGAAWTIVDGSDMSGNMLVGGEDAGDRFIAVKWVRPDRVSPYVKSYIGGGLEGTIHVSDDGKTILGAIRQERLNTSGSTLIDAVPVVWTEDEGFVQLEPFIFPPGDTTNAFQWMSPRGLSSDGNIAIGYAVQGDSDYPMAWRKVDGMWERIPGLDRPFVGMLVAVN